MYLVHLEQHLSNVSDSSLSANVSFSIVSFLAIFFNKKKYWMFSNKLQNSVPSKGTHVVCLVTSVLSLVSVTLFWNSTHLCLTIALYPWLYFPALILSACLPRVNTSSASPFWFVYRCHCDWIQLQSVAQVTVSSQLHLKYSEVAVMLIFKINLRVEMTRQKKRRKFSL